MILSETDIEHYQPTTLETFRASRHIRRKILIERRGVFTDFDAVSVPAPGVLPVEDRWLQTNDVAEKVILFAPHNFPEVHHLNLAESYLFRSKGERDESLCISDPVYYRKELHREFVNTCAINMLNELLNSVICNPYSVTRFIKSFLGYARTSRRVQNKEKIPLTRFCLNALHRQSEMFWTDERLVVEVLKTFCVSHFHKEDLVTGDYSPECLDYIIRSCAAANFDIRLYFMHDERGRAIPFCPLTSCIISGQDNCFPKLKVLLQHGFELQAVNSSITNLTYVFVRMNRQLGTDVIESISQNSLNDRRHYLLLEFLYMVRKSFGDENQWVQCSDILFNSIADRFIHYQELHCLLTQIYREDVVKEIERRCALFISFERSSTPRKLKHLCRCIIRMELKKYFQLPGGIDALPLPQSIKEYLNLDH